MPDDMIRRFLLFALCLITGYQANAQKILDSRHYLIAWNNPSDLRDGFVVQIDNQKKEKAFYSDAYPEIPFFQDQVNLFDRNIEVMATIEVENVIAVSDEECKALTTNLILSDTDLTTEIFHGRDGSYALLRFVPVVKNPLTGQNEKLVSFTITYNYTLKAEAYKNKISYSNRSVLAEGNWFKFKLNKSGVYKISYSDLQNLGLNLSGVDPRKIRIFGNGGGTLPESNAAFRYDDLYENPIRIVGEEDGVFNQNDYILFYGHGPLVWDYDETGGYFVHRPNYYDDFTFYFITVGTEAGKRIETVSTEGQSSETIDSFLDYQIHEQDLYNLSNTGKTWYGDLFDVTLSKDFSFDFPGIITNKQGKIVVQMAARAFSPSSFQLLLDGNLKQTIPIDATQATGYDWAKGNGASFQFLPSSQKVNVTLKYVRSLNSSRGWLDYISVNAWRSMSFTNGQLHFNNTYKGEANSVKTMQLSNATGVEVWDITQPVNPKQVSGQFSGTTFSFKTKAEDISHYIAFDNSAFLSIEKAGAVANQNLHGIRDIDYLIVSHPDFLEQAERLATMHRNQSGLTVLVTTPQLIYNEFSSGAQDITAIRDFIRMLYVDSSPGREIKYVLMFGDASFDYKDRITGNTNFVPTFETVASLNLVNSIATDDYFGYLDPNEGDTANGLVDVGIGRLPVVNITEATQAVDKIERYLSNNEEVMSPWRNEITFVCDDGDSNIHLNDAESVVELVRTDYPEFNIDKIYLDAYKQTATPSGQKAPDVNDAINKRVERGSLIVNYSGHGGEVGWTEERILQIADINSWKNRNKLPVFITATCEFSRFDDAQRKSAGEMVFLNPNGGAIAMFTTARATYSSTNLRLNRAIFNNNIFIKENGEFLRFGDVMRRSKIAGDANDRKFVLLGDPAIQISFPREKVVTTHINGVPVELASDTLQALDHVVIRGKVTSRDGVLLSHFNGVLYATVFDKENTITTYGDQGPTTSFLLRSSIINKSTVEVKDGLFEFSFMIPKDISYKYGTGRISYYATDYQTDAQGFFEDFYVGGFSNNNIVDNAGPEIRLFIGDTTFKNGGFTDENPRLFAQLSDDNGINMTGAGIGHDLVASLSGASERYAVINEFFIGKLNQSTHGTVTYPFYNLKPGKHTLTLKAWDILNNSAVATIDFEVVASSGFKLENLRNYPNPFTESTYFVFNHNQSGEVLSIEIQIYNSTGHIVRTLITEDQYNSGYQSQAVYWDGKTENGQTLPKGLYLYRVIVKNADGLEAIQSARLIRI